MFAHLQGPGCLSKFVINHGALFKNVHIKRRTVTFNVVLVIFFFFKNLSVNMLDMTVILDIVTEIFHFQVFYVAMISFFPGIYYL